MLQSGDTLCLHLSIHLSLVFQLAAKYPPQIPYRLWKITFLDDWSSHASLQTAHWHQICEQWMPFSARQVPRGEAYWDDNIYGNELQQNFLSRNRLTGLQTARSTQAMRKVSWWSLPLQLFGAPGSLGNKLKLYSWSCCKRFCGSLTKYYPACFQVSWTTKYFEVYAATQKKESYTSLMNNGNSLQEQIAASSWPVRSFCIQLTIKITSIKIVPAQNKEYFYLVLSRIKRKNTHKSQHKMFTN